jgi:hypothetical protein
MLYSSRIGGNSLLANEMNTFANARQSFLKPNDENASSSNKIDRPQNRNVSFSQSKQPSLLPSLSFLDSSFFMKPELFLPNQNNKRSAEVDNKPQTLEEFLESIDMSAYYNLIHSKGIKDLDTLLSSNKKVFIF